MLPSVSLTSGGSSRLLSQAKAPAASSAPPQVAEPGKPGLPGMPGRDGVGFRWCGPWMKKTPYKVNDVVAFQGSSYIALKENTNVFPTTKVVWGVLAARGTSNSGSGGGGAKGDKGDKGDPGLVWTGPYDDATSYIPTDAVSYLGSLYICILATTGNAPSMDSTYWSFLLPDGSGGGGLTHPQVMARISMGV